MPTTHSRPVSPEGASIDPERALNCLTDYLPSQISVPSDYSSPYPDYSFSNDTQNRSVHLSHLVNGFDTVLQNEINSIRNEDETT